jgi:DNA-binding XRE family transcriptional regulator
MTPTELKQARESLGMTQDALAAALGLSRSAIARMEAGQSRIVKAIDLAVKWLKANPEETGGPKQRG